MNFEINATALLIYAIGMLLAVPAAIATTALFIDKKLKSSTKQSNSRKALIIFLSFVGVYTIYAARSFLNRL